MASTSSPARSASRASTSTGPIVAASCAASTPHTYEDDLRNKIFEGQLSKFTNVVKGWQYRWFILRPQTGHLEYYLMDEDSHGVHSIGKHRSSQPLIGTMVVPSDDDSQAFSVVFASGDTYKLRAANTRERQAWVDRIRHVGHLFDAALAQNHHNMTSLMGPVTPPLGSKSHLSSNGLPSDALQNLSLSVLDAFGSVHDILQQTDVKHQILARSIENLPLRPANHKLPSCLDEDLLMVKATSQAALQSLESALAVLQELQEVNRSVVQPVKSKFGVPLSPKRSMASLNRSDVISTIRFGGSSQSVNVGENFRISAPDTLSVRSFQVGSSSTGFLTSVQPSAALLSTSSPSMNAAASSSSLASTGDAKKLKKDKKASSASATSDKDKAGQGS